MSTRPSRVPAPALPPLLKHLNERTVLEAIRSGAPISRAEISRRAGISKPTVSLALQSLLDAGLVREATSETVGFEMPARREISAREMGAPERIASRTVRSFRCLRSGGRAGAATREGRVLIGSRTES